MKIVYGCVGVAQIPWTSRQIEYFQVEQSTFTIQVFDELVVTQ